MKIRLELTQGIIKTHDDVYTCIYNTEMRQHFFDYVLRLTIKNDITKMNQANDM